MVEIRKALLDNIYMKLRRLFIVALASLLLTGCDFIELTKDSHKPGLDGSVESKTKTITYFEGDAIGKSSLTAHEITFDIADEEVVISKDEPNALKEYIVDNENIIQSVDRAEEISTFYNFEESEKLDSGIKVGYASDSVNGNLNLSFNCKIKACEVYGYLRYGLRGLEQGNEIVIDENAAISANGSRFIKLPYSPELDQLEQKVCSYNFANEDNLLQLCVYGKRAVITKIIVYS